MSKQYFLSEWSHSYEVGYGVAAGSKNMTYGIKETQLYLVKDLSSNLGFKMITGYPLMK